MKKIVNVKIIAVILVLCIIFIVLYGYTLRKYNKPDILEKNLYCTGCDGWAFTHMFFFMLLGYLDPNKYIQYCIIGIIWELIETFLGQYKLKFFGKRLVLVGERKKDSNEYDENAWWYGRVTDIAFNLVGYIIGSYINSLQYGKCKID
jgi:hypothetical protein